MLCARADEMFDRLEVYTPRRGNYFEGCCPVHGGDNPRAFRLYTEGDEQPGYWRCLTRECESRLMPTVLGFIHGILRSRDPRARFPDAIAWACDFLGIKPADIKADPDAARRRRIASEVARLAPMSRYGTEATKRTFTREEVRKHLKVPSPYFLARGYSAEVLDRFDVGDYPVNGRELSGRAMAPVYSDDGSFVLGFTGRSVHPKCLGCHYHHAGNCPRNALEESRSCKWYHHDFSTESVLYNWWRVGRSEPNSVCLVEGPGDVWRLEEAGINCGVAMFGAHLHDPQQILLETAGVTNVVILTDMDASGRKAANEIKTRLRRIFKVFTPDLPANDLGDMTVEQVRNLVCPLV